MTYQEFLNCNETVIGKKIWITDYRRGKSGWICKARNTYISRGNM